MKDIVFSWAEDANGRMVHVDDVPRGLSCGCRCPNCHEPLLARQGDKNEHGFAHHSEVRQARLDKCYMVTLYKLAEQFIQEQKCICLPSYYGIFPSKEVSFKMVKIDGSFERDDKQPDVVATCDDGTHYLIEFTFAYKVQHKKAIDYKNMNCIEIDLLHQSLESLSDFLKSKPNDDWHWVNNDLYFNGIENRYANAGKNIKLVNEAECCHCELMRNCCAVRVKSTGDILRIENNGEQYRICKLDLYQIRYKEYLEQKECEERQRKELQEREEQHQRELENARRLQLERETKRKQEIEERRRRLESQDPSMRSCFDCESNLKWANRNGYANCGCYKSLGVPRNTPPDTAKSCPRYRPCVL